MSPLFDNNFTNQANPLKINEELVSHHSDNRAMLAIVGIYHRRQWTGIAVMPIFGATGA
jgi:uncharacterized iron-regulated protein